MRQPRRYTTERLDDQRVLLTDLRTKQEREFWVQSEGGYVREITWERPGTLGLQVCDGLCHSGSTLESSPSYLLTLIRREARKYYAQEED